MAERVLVTGGAGYLGSILVPALLEQGYEVTVVDDFRYRVNSLAAVCAHPGFQVIRADARNAMEMRSAAAKADWVIPLAALVGAPICALDPLATESINRDAIRMLMSFLSKDQRVLFPNTNSGYGIGDKNAMCDETTPLRPISLYGKTKVEAEAIVMEHGNSIAFRLATVFGMAPRMRLDLLVNDFTYRAMRDRTVVIFEGHFKRNYIHIRDVAKAFLHGMGKFGQMRNQTYNMGLSTANLSKVELAERIKKQLPKFIYIESQIGQDPDKRDYIVSNAKLEATGWRPFHSLDDGICELIKGYTTITNEIYGNV